MPGKNILFLGECASAEALCDHLRNLDWQVHRATDLRTAKRLLAQHPFTVGLIVQADLDDAACTELDAFCGNHGNLEWVGGFDAASIVKPACRDLIIARLFDHHTFPLDLSRLTSCIGHAHGRAMLRKAEGAADPLRGDAVLVGQSVAIAELLRQTRRTASTDAPVLIRGESGSGKELVAQTVHRCSRRVRGPFVAVNCGTIQPTLIQSELFGHEKGSFTGAVAEKRGLFEEANGGTLFLDEIGDLPLDLQVNLLRFLQEGTVTPVGSTRVLKLDVRVVAATHVDLDGAVAAGRFREDLYYRLAVLPLHVAPLRERREDIRLLAEHFFRRFSAEKRPRLKGFSHLAILALEAHHWPGNVRELINRVRCSMIMAEGRLIMPADLGLQASRGPAPYNVLDEARRNAEHTAIHSILQQTGRNVAVSARQLGVSRMTLYRLMDKHGLNISQ